jgi:hypothetical protein
MKNGWQKVSKRAWYLYGGFSNPNLFRKANKCGAWSYWAMTR